MKLGKLCVFASALVAAASLWADQPGKFVTYIQSTGTQWMFLEDYKPSPSAHIVVEAAFDDLSANCAVFCSRGDSYNSTSFSLFHIAADGLRLDYNTNGGKTQKLTAGTKYTLDCNANVLSLDGTAICTRDKATFETKYNTALFASYAGDPTGSNPGLGNYAKMKLYSFKAYEGEELAIDLCPCTTEDGAVALWDNVGQKLYFNKGTGVFTASTEEAADPRSATTTLAITAQGGSVTADPASEDGTYARNAEVTLTATPEAGKAFLFWTGDVPAENRADNPLAITMEKDKQVTANFFTPEHHAATLCVNGYTSETPLPNFPVLVRVSEKRIDGFSYAACAAGGADIRFTSADGKTVYPSEVDTWNIDGDSLFWVRLPALEYRAVFKIHWGDATGLDAPAAAQVWKQNGAGGTGNYLAVWHMDAAGDDTAEPDSAQFADDLDMTLAVTNGTATKTAVVTSVGAIGAARRLNAKWTKGGNAFIAPSWYAKYSGAPITYSFWLNMKNPGGSTWHAFFGRGATGHWAKGLACAGSGTPVSRIYWSPSGGDNPTEVDKAIANELWQHITLTYADGKASVYVNGVRKANYASTLSDIDAPLMIGVRNNFEDRAAIGGSFDEFRVLGGMAVSADWVKAAYDTVVDDLYIGEAKTIWSNTNGGLFKEGSNWTTGSAPAAGSQAIFEDDATYRVTFPTVYAVANALSVTKNGGTTTFDTTGGSWTLPADSRYVYKQTAPILFNNGVGNAFVVKQGDETAAIMKSENGTFSFTGGEEPKVAFTSGTINFHNPDGTTPATLNTVLPNAEVDGETEFSGGTATLPNVALAAAKGRTTSKLLFTGGTHDVNGVLSVTNRMALGNEIAVEVAGKDTVLNLNGGYTDIASGSGEGDYKSFHSDAIRVTDGATLNVGGFSFRAFAADFNLVADHATLNFDPECFALGGQYRGDKYSMSCPKNYFTNHVALVDSEFSLGSRVKYAWIGAYDPWTHRWNQGEKGFTYFGATNTAFNVKPTLTIMSCDFVFKNCTGTLASVEGYSHPAKVTVEGGALTNTSWNVNNGSDGAISCSLTIDGGVHETKKLTMVNSLSPSACGYLNFYGGTLNVTDTLCFNPHNYTGDNGSYAIFNQTGGELTAKAVSASSNSGAHMTVNLTGGVLAVPYLPSGSKHGEFLGDGGTIRTTVKNTTVLANNSTFDYRLGAKGLAIVTEFADTKCSAVFKDKEGEAGVLYKDGSGTLTITMAGEHAKTVVRAGTLRYAAGITNQNEMVVAGGTLDFTGANGKPAFTSLTLGDGAAVGELKLDNSTNLVLGAFVPTNAKLTLTSPATDGTYGVITVKGDQTSQLDNWKNTQTDLPKGKQHVYTATYDAASDTTTFSVTVQDQKEASGDVIWTGNADTTWSTAANWTPAEVPTAETTAHFTGEAAPSTVSIEGAATAAGLEFASQKGYTLAGSGTLKLADGVAGKIDVKGGTNAIDVATQLKAIIPITVEEDAKLTLSESVTGDGFEKEGAGTLALTAENNFKYALVSNGGTLEVGNAAALTTPALTFNGTFDYTGDEPDTITTPFTVDGGTNKAKTVFNNDTDLTLAGGFAHTSGAMLKAGEGTLTIAADKTHAVTCTDGETITVSNGCLRFTAASGTTAKTAAFSVKDTLVLQGPGQFNISSGFTVDPYVDAPSNTEAKAVLTDVSYATLRSVNLFANNNAGNITKPMTAALYLTNATFNVSGDLSMRGSFAKRDFAKIMAKDTTLTMNTFYFHGAAFDFTFDNTKVSMSRLIYNDNSKGVMRFLNGGVFGWNGSHENNSKFGDRNAYGCHYYFDGGAISCKSGGWSFIERDCFTIETAAKGLTVNVTDAAGTFNVCHEIVGVGGVTKTGPGTLKMVSVRDAAWGKATTNVPGVAVMQYAGPTRVEAGALVLSNGACRVDSRLAFAAGTTLNLSDSLVGMGEVAGSPTIVDGTLDAARLVVSNGDAMAFGEGAAMARRSFKIAYAYTADEIAARAPFSARIAFGANAPSGTSVAVDLGNGKALENPPTLGQDESITGVIATYTGATPDVSKWYVTGLGGKGVRGVVSAAGGEIRVTLLPTKGLMFIVK